jgi:hypothetical protein
MLAFVKERAAGAVQTKRLGILLAIVTAALALTGCQHHVCEVLPKSVSVDPSGNGILEPDETVTIAPTWGFHSVSTPAGCLVLNHCAPYVALGLVASSFTGPDGGTYTIVDGTANYGIVQLGSDQSCLSTGSCYQVAVGMPSGRPAAHWDARLTEDTSGSPDLGWLSPSEIGLLEPLSCPTTYLTPRTWTLHVGASFDDVPAGNNFYSWVETAFHHAITAGCGEGQFCPGNPIRREQMAVFLLRAKDPAHVPPPCRGVFVDVPCPGPFTNWVEEVVQEGIIPSCSASEFCPSDDVSRREMARWILTAKLGSGYQPPAAQGIFADVGRTEPDAPWIEDLYHRQITAGCASNPLRYCPEAPNTRAQMAVFIDKTFELGLY